MINDRPKISLIGAGFMGEAIVSGLIHNGTIRASQITLSDPNESRLHKLAAFGVSVSVDNVAAIREAEVVILCIKPQHLCAVASEIKPHIPSGALVMSILAGTEMERVSSALGHAPVIRLMPNLPSAIGVGFTTWIANSHVNEEQMEKARAIIRSLGKDIQVSSEKEIDLVTSVSGAGPALTFLFMEAFIDAAIHIGIAHDLALELVVQTVKGSTQLAEVSTDSLSKLRAKVTSPGGVTAESIAELEERGFRSAIDRAVLAGVRRTIELGKLNHSE